MFFYSNKNFLMTLFLQEYLHLFIYFLISFLLAIVILTLSIQISENNPDTQKLSSYECGFDPYEDARNTFDVRFYLVALVFLIFDLETVFLFPWCVCINELSNTGVAAMLEFIFELFIGLVYAIQVKAFNWK